ncbi:phytoene synthase [Betaproteobacteria bacterium]|nr:phytoene synthase [Betaproteobacteria bacterium]GHU14415.1 phytoene synthase [Betaproteobacteria bacterium]GHU18554.1 phytoene synthase [Betaproteobacteria bacterium]
MNPHQYCQDKAAASGSSFYYSFMFLPPARRQAITALYAFCREVDDVVDECTDLALAHDKLGWWRQEIERVFGATATHPVGLALQDVIGQFKISREHLDEIIDGMAMDLSISRYADFAALERYCYHVASVVGLLAAEIFGYQDAKTLDYAYHLGIAFQLTNIIRDVGEDARRGRIYLPVDELQRFNVPAADISNAHSSDNFRALMRFQHQRAQHYYDQALNALPAIDRKSQRPGLIMAAIYRALLDEIARDGFQVLDRRTSLTPLRKVWLAGLTWLKS